MESWSDGVFEEWSAGVMECWSTGVMLFRYWSLFFLPTAYCLLSSAVGATDKLLSASGGCLSVPRSMPHLLVPPDCCNLLTVYCILLTAYSVLPTAYSLLLTVFDVGNRCRLRASLFPELAQIKKNPVEAVAPGF